MKKVVENAWCWRRTEVLQQCSSGVSVALRAALPRFFCCGFVCVRLYRSVRWIRESGYGRRPTGPVKPATPVVGRCHPGRHLVDCEKILQKTLIRLANRADLRVIRDAHASAISNPKSATESIRFHTDFTQNDGQWLLAFRPYTKQLTHQCP